VPPNVSPEAACTVPTIFLTADACLNAATVVQPGQRVLVHAATGGLGLAAVQVTTALGGVPLGTAGSSTKRAYLRSYWGGVQTAVNSRTTGAWQCVSWAAGCLLAANGCTTTLPPSWLPTSCLQSHRPAPTAEFAADLAQLGPEVVDVVLNSLTSPGMLAASLAVLRLGGAFIEVGKRDIWAAARIAQVSLLPVACCLLAYPPNQGCCWQGRAGQCSLWCQPCLFWRPTPSTYPLPAAGAA
jgi:NADPH:quinone reductase-like Zn-dependent oxidoreductase